MKIYNNIGQRTQEWYELKMGKISASAIAPIMAVKGLGKAAVTLALQIIAERYQKHHIMGFTSFSMEQGINREVPARETYERTKDIMVTQVGGVQMGNLWYSPDGLIVKDGDIEGIIEIKCFEPKHHIEMYLEDVVQDEFQPQIQFGMAITGAKYCDMVFFNPDMVEGKECRIIRQPRDDKYIDIMNDRLEQMDKLIAKMEGNINGSV